MDIELILTAGTLLVTSVNTALLTRRPGEVTEAGSETSFGERPFAPVPTPAPRVLPDVPGDPAPPWGTVERKEWHRQQRNYHAQMTVEAGKAAQEEA